MKDIWKYTYVISQGVGITLLLLFGSLILGTVLAVIASILRYKSRYKGVTVRLISLIISVLRGTPLILQLSFVYFGLPNVTNLKLSLMSTGILTFGLNSFAYISEILRAGIDSLPKGQFEAAKSLHIPLRYTWQDIILPQVFRNILPPMVSQSIALLKDTALISTIGGLDIMRQAQLLSAQDFTYFEPLTIAGIYYYLFVVLIEWFGRRLERRIQYAYHS